MSDNDLSKQYIPPDIPPDLPSTGSAQYAGTMDPTKYPVQTTGSAEFPAINTKDYFPDLPIKAEPTYSQEVMDGVKMEKKPKKKKAEKRKVTTIGEDLQGSKVIKVRESQISYYVKKYFNKFLYLFKVGNSFDFPEK